LVLAVPQMSRVPEGARFFSGLSMKKRVPAD
jgi:hypothetical protein